MESEDLSPAERTYADTLIALARSLRSAEEMAEASQALNPLLDVRDRRESRGDEAGVARIDTIAAAALKAALGAERSTSGMGVDLCLDYLHMAFDEAKEEVESEPDLGEGKP
ncbi:hypothetical protein EON79_11720 [bacterium]|nr:MAG: hypothetical protein EON79_11720 [bacterium]